MNEIELSILIVFSTEEKELLIECLERIYNSVEHISFEVIIVNNGGVDIDELYGKFKNLKIVKNAINLGIGKARNQCFLESKGKVVQFVEPDIFVVNRTIEKMYKCLIEHKDIDGLATKVILEDGRMTYNFGYLPSLKYPFCEFFNIPERRAEDLDKIFKYNHLQQVEFLGGAGVMLRREVLYKVGLYDERFIYGWEDTDFCYRAKKKGVKLFYYYPHDDENMKFIHLLHQGAKRTHGRQIDFYISEIYYFRKHYGYVVGSIVKLFITIFTLLRILVSFLKLHRAEVRRICWRLICKIW
jgi:GT2 family glycosyltransferase